MLEREKMNNVKCPIYNEQVKKSLPTAGREKWLKKRISIPKETG
jgi:hypothetical protein